MKPVNAGKKIELPYSERELLEDLTPAKAHAEALAKLLPLLGAEAVNELA